MRKEKVDKCYPLFDECKIESMFQEQKKTIDELGRNNESIIDRVILDLPIKTPTIGSVLTRNVYKKLLNILSSLLKQKTIKEKRDY